MTTPREKIAEMRAKKQQRFQSNVDNSLFEKYLNKEITYKELLERSEMTRSAVNKKIGEMKNGK